jgi:DNA-binding transcriptional LysR family regulator
VLFLRTTRSVRLSVAGLALLPAAQRAITSVEECTRAVKSKGDMPPMTITMGTRHELGLSWILPQVDPLREMHGFLELNLYFGSGPDLVNRVRNLELDCAVTSTPITDPKLDTIRLHREDYVLVGAPTLLKKQPLRTNEEAADHTLIDIDDRLTLFRYWRDSPKGEPLVFAKLARFGTIEAIRRRVLAGAGVGVLPKYLVEPDIAEKRLRILLPHVEAIHDWFRLVFRSDDGRRSVFELLAKTMSAFPLQ